MSNLSVESLLLFLGPMISIIYLTDKKFEDKLEINKGLKIIWKNCSIIILFIFSIWKEQVSLHFIFNHIIFSIIIYSYLHIFKKESVYFKIYWIIKLECFISLAYIFIAPIFYILMKIGINIDNPLILSLLFNIYIYILIHLLTKFTLRVDYLEKRLLIILTVYIIFLIFLLEYITFYYSIKILILFCILILLEYIMTYTLLYYLEKNRMDYLKINFENESLKLKENYLNGLEQINKEIKRYRHDMSNHMNVVHYLLEEDKIYEVKEYMKQLEKEFIRINKNFFHIETQNTILDYLLNSKVFMAKTKSIEVNLNIHIEGAIILSDMDLCTLIGNLLDNSIEACEAYQGEKIINISIQNIDASFMIEIQNSSNPIRIDNKGRYLTLKKGPNHGYGIEQIDSVVTKYSGMIKREYKSQMFMCKILIFPS